MLVTVVSVYMGARSAGPCIYILIDYQANDNNLIMKWKGQYPWWVPVLLEITKTPSRKFILVWSPIVSGFIILVLYWQKTYMNLTTYIKWSRNCLPFRTQNICPMVITALSLFSVHYLICSHFKTYFDNTFLNTASFFASKTSS